MNDTTRSTSIVRLARILAALTLAAGLLTACGDDSGDTGAGTSPPAETAEGSPTDVSGEPDEASQDGGGAAAGSADATIVVDGTAHELSEVRRCEQPETGSSETQILEAIHGLSAEDGTLVLVLQITETPVSETHWVSWRGPEGLFDTFVVGGGTGEWIGDGEITYDGPIIALDDGRAVGSAILADSQTLDPDDRIEITFDVAVPASTTPC